MKHKFEKKLKCNDLSMVWVESEKCIYCGVEKKLAGEKACYKRTAPDIGI